MASRQKLQRPHLSADCKFRLGTHVYELIEELLPSLHDVMARGLWSIRGAHFRIHRKVTVEEFGESQTLHVTPMAIRTPSNQLMMDTVNLMSTGERIRLLADIYEIVE